jgi:hypothetical protein
LQTKKMVAPHRIEKDINTLTRSFRGACVVTTFGMPATAYVAIAGKDDKKMPRA